MAKKRTPAANPNFIRYSSFYASRKTAGNRLTAPVQPQKPRRGLKKIDLFFLVIITLAVAAFFIPNTHKYIAEKIDPSTSSTLPIAKANVCADNKLNKFVLISISQRHMWACNTGTQVYDSAVVTGYEKDPADLTPPGTYSIYAKETDITLKGSDSKGSWSDPVSYWMPFLYNKYGAYGFHDATWRPSSAFGNISPDSSNASHGCVELPLATAKWLYGWAPIGTTVTIES